MKKAIYAAAAAVALFATACSKHAEGWSIEGNLVDAPENTVLALEGFNNGQWYVIDSLAVSSNGHFEYNAPQAAPYPDVMRLTMGKSSIYFPIDSLDHLTIEAGAATFDTGYKLSGSNQAATFQRLDSLVNATVAAIGTDAALNDSVFKRNLFGLAFNDPSVVPVYYIINKSIGGRPIYDINRPADRRLHGAVAQRFATERPDDPRTKFLADAYRSARQAGTVTEIQADQTSLIDIVRFDAKGKKRALSEVAKPGHVTLLSFTSYDLETSAAYNALLNEIWVKNHAAGLEIYQVAFDADETMWRSRAANLPWTAVWNATSDGDTVLRTYNVGALPMTFIIDRNGEIAARVIDPKKLASEVARFL